MYYNLVSLRKREMNDDTIEDPGNGLIYRGLTLKIQISYLEVGF